MTKLRDSFKKGGKQIGKVIKPIIENPVEALAIGTAVYGAAKGIKGYTAAKRAPNKHTTNKKGVKLKTQTKAYQEYAKTKAKNEHDKSMKKLDRSGKTVQAFVYGNAAEKVMNSDEKASPIILPAAFKGVE